MRRNSVLGGPPVRRFLAVGVLGVLVVACSAGVEAEQNPSIQPSVTVLGTAVNPSQPAPSLGAAVSTEREQQD